MTVEKLERIAYLSWHRYGCGYNNLTVAECFELKDLLLEFKLEEDQKIVARNRAAGIWTDTID